MWLKNDRFACAKYHFLDFELATQYKMIFSKCIPKLKNVKRTGFSAFHIENEEKRCRQLQGGESADFLVLPAFFIYHFFIAIILVIVFITITIITITISTIVATIRIIFIVTI